MDSSPQAQPAATDQLIYAGAIACIGWGSLVHRPGTLPCRGSWRLDGPMLPIEFARESANGSITLVICPQAPRVQTCWALLDVRNINEARDALGLREYPSARPKWIQEFIGYSEGANKPTFGLEADTIGRWVTSHGLAGAVWTNLPCKFQQTNGLMPTGKQVVDYLRSLQGESRDTAEAYVRKAPAQVDTPYRRLIEKELGWTTLS